MRKITAYTIIGFIVSVIVILFWGFHIYNNQSKDEPPQAMIPYSSSIQKSAQKEGLNDTTNEPIIHHVNDVYNGQHN